MKRIYLLVALPFLLSACYISKSLDREVHVRLIADVPVNVVNNSNSNFTAFASNEQYAEKLLEGMKGEFNGSNVVPDNVNPEFEVLVTEFTLTETTKIETVNDTTSDDHGKKFELTELDLTAKGIVTRLSDGVQYEWWANKSKEEKVTSLRSAGQIVTGENKEKNEYREKEFSEDEALDLSWNCGRRSGNSVVKKIIGASK